MRLTGKDWAAQIRKACEATYLFWSGELCGCVCRAYDVVWGRSTLHCLQGCRRLKEQFNLRVKLLSCLPCCMRAHNPAQAATA